MHREYEDLLLLYTTHSLDETGRQRLEAHLHTCETCRASLKEWQALSLAVRHSANQRADSLPALRLPDLEQEKNTMQATYPLPQRHYYMPITFAAIAAMLLFTMVALFMRTPGSSLTVFVQPTMTDAVEIILPTHPIRADRRIDSDDVALVSIPAEVAPANRLTSLEDVIGKFTRTDIFCGQPLLADMVADRSPIIPEYHGFLEMNSDEVCNISPNPDDELVSIVVAGQEIDQGETITEDMVELQPYPSQLIPANAVLNLEDVMGQAAVIDIFEEQFVTGQIIGIPPSQVYVDLVIAAQPIENGDVIQPEDVTMYRMPMEALSFNALAMIDDAVGRIARTNIPCGTAILTNMLVENARNVSYEVPSIRDECQYVDLSPLEEPVEFVDVVIAVQEIARGSIIPRNALSSRPYPVQLVSADTVTGSPNDLAGRIARTDIFREQMIQIPFIGASVDNPASAILPEGTVAVSIPMRSITSTAYGVQDVDRVDLIATLLFVEDANGRRLVTEETPDAIPVPIRVASNALVIFVGSLPSESGEPAASNDAITVAVSPQESLMLNWLIAAEVPITLALTPEATNLDLPLAETTPQIAAAQSQEIPDGMVAVSVPRTQILAVPHYPLSDRMDIVAILRFADVDEEFQRLVPTGTPVEHSITQQIISNALQIPSDDPDMMTLVVSPEDAVILTWLVEARIPLILVSPGSWTGNPISIPIVP